MGTCTYTLSKLCESNSSLPYFNVEAANEHRGSNTRVSYVRYVDIDVYGYRLNLGKNRVVKVRLDQVLPLTLAQGVSISFSGQYVVVTTDFGLNIKFDGNHRAEIILPSTYMSKVCGICGNYNGNKADDFLNPDGEMETNSASLGEGHTPNCTTDEKHMIQSNEYCGLITDPNGPFRNCQSVVDPQSYSEACQYDLCELHLNNAALCQNLQAYADVCQAAEVQLTPWRNATFCPLDCSANSHYEPCAAACPATCVDPIAPYSCSLPCVEGCVCDSGYLLYNDRCVPSQQCGCWHNGQHYPVGSEFWTDNTCSSKCTCPARGSKVQCSDASCPAGQYCGVQNGKPECLEQSYGICHVHGDPHYNSFDKVTHNFMGNCTYTLAKVCSNTTSLPYFNVEATNEHRGNTRVSYVREVLVEVYGVRIAIVKREKSQVNNVRQTLPVSAAGGAITVSRSGRYIVLETDFNLRVSYDADHSVEVKVPTTYFNLTCGMCGNFNNRREDDYMMPNGQQAADSNALGESWQVPDNDSSCGVPVAPRPCSEEEEKLYRSDQFCGMLTARPGSFERCHAVINPQSYFDTCFYDLCALNGGQEFLCAALEAYADACQAAGVTLLPWRNATFCPVACPPNSRYNPCTSACPATCTDPLAPKNCSRPCLEGCECNNGFVISGGQCVSMSNCGCLQNGKYYQKGEAFWQADCAGQCVCAGNGTVVCNSDTCEVSEVCKVQNGLLGCYPLHPRTCVVEGDPHYHTFDKQLHHFMGTCTYTLSKLCESNSSLPYFNVEAANEHRGGNTRVSYVQYVDVDVAGQRIRLGKGGRVTVNGVAEVLPCTPSMGVQVSSSGFYTVVTTDFGLRVKFDGNHRVEVTLPSTFGQKVCGMCGNYNGMAADDFLNPEGVLEPDSTSLGNSWQVSNDSRCVWPPSSCSAGPLPTPACNETDKQVIASSHFCGLLTDTSGPFQMCHAVLSPSGYFDTCLYDLCELGLDREALCNSLQSYADACRSLGIKIPVWRNATFCPITCPANSHYEPCAAACPATCVDPMAPATCSLPCVEGCVCDSGYLLYNDRCVPSQQCGCWHNGQHYPRGLGCTCPARGSKVQCSDASCPAGQYCGVQNGKPECLEQSYGICHVHSDPHYNTFDKVTHSFMGNCTYTLAKVCSNTTSLPYFNVEATNEHRGNTRVSYVREVLVEVYGVRIAIVKREKSQVLVNNVRQTLPVSAAGGAITVSRSGRYIVLETDFNLRVSYDADHSVEVKVPTTYFNLTCGMCGNFNNRREDDYMMPNGQQAADSNALGESWQVPDNDSSCGVPVTPRPCSEEEEKLYRSDQFCGMLTARPGSFERCHAVINPQSYFDTCFYDLCALNGGQEFLCAALEAYADACQAAGVTLLPWRNATFSLLCPANSYYDPCMTGCPATCVDRQAPQNCSKPCVEGCACTSGFLLSGDTCVPEAHCGCLFEGNYYSVSENPALACTPPRCRCEANGQMVCSALSCGEDEVCKIQDGQRGCYPASTALCHIYGDPHYSTFDGKLHHFQGSCNYTVVTGCDNSSVGFSVTTRNKHRGSQSWTALNSVALSMEGHLFTLLSPSLPLIQINGALASLPASPAPGVTISLSGSYVRVATKLGLQLQFNGDQELLVRVSEKHKGKLCGLCGTYTGSQQDDFMRPDGVVSATGCQMCGRAPFPSRLPCLWQRPRGPSMWSGCTVLSPHRRSPCHAVLPPRTYFESCVYDQCATGGSTEQLCNDLGAYAAACAEAGVALGDWSAGTVCAITCPANSHYEPCAAACPATCVDPMAPATCSLPCVEGCVCDSGYLLYNDRCVPSQQCGCWHNGQHYPVGSEFWTDNTCSSKCTCPARGSKVQCSDASCPAGQYCGVQNGKPECLEQSYGICHVHSDPHYNTFDKVTHSFMGNCTYTLAKVCSNTTSLPYFNVEATNDGLPCLAWQLFPLGQKPSPGPTVTLPVSAAGGAITVSRSGRYIVLETDFNLRVSYDADHSVEVKVPTTYFNLTCGMCGNFNNRREDDYMMPNGQQAADSNALGESWQVPDNDSSCGVPVAPRPCSEEEEKLYRSDQFCGMLTARPGSFERCHAVINPQSYFDTCFYDLCALNGGQEFLCAALEAYADACQAAGVTLLPWRNATFCPLLCPANSYYDPCMTGCPATCVDRQAPQNCSKPCVEGCACTSGFLLSGDTCVPEAHCGCLFEGNYYSVSENPALACTPPRVCKIQDGQRGCYPASTALCHIYGDPHYSTFDGKLHHFQGSCNYTVVTGCDNSSVGFSVTTRNKHRGSQSWTALNSVALSMEGLHIALRKKKAVYINGALASLPASPAPGVTISLSGSYVRVATKLGLQLQFNGDQELLVRVSEKHKGKLCGLCGTTEQLCNDLGAYAAACAEAGVALGDWSAGTVCGKCSVDPLCGPDSRNGAAVVELSPCVT
uniref:VWFD domain-containing protein n=1 Tax=Aquila chrysaetos chrysaetos TaxID=223781 RepID=A0A663DPG6_AQUCH